MIDLRVVAAATRGTSPSDMLVLAFEFVASNDAEIPTACSTTTSHEKKKKKER